MVFKPFLWILDRLFYLCIALVGFQIPFFLSEYDKQIEYTQKSLLTVKSEISQQAAGKPLDAFIKDLLSSSTRSDRSIGKTWDQQMVRLKKLTRILEQEPGSTTFSLQRFRFFSDFDILWKALKNTKMDFRPSMPGFLFATILMVFAGLLQYGIRFFLWPF